MPNPSSTAYDHSLKAISHYGSFPVMVPFVGEHYDSADHLKLLVVGESFYFPAISTLHKDATIWYSMRQEQLNADERAHINCRGLLECNWQSPGHKMYRVLNACLARFQLAPLQERAVSHFSFTNSFLRPASQPGASFRQCCTDLDIAMGTEVVEKVIDALAPDLTIFASRYAWDAIGSTVAKRFSKTKFDFVSHPTDSFHWDVSSYDHGRAKFISLLSTWTRGTEVIG